MIKPGQVYISKTDPSRLAIIERVDSNSRYSIHGGDYIYYRVAVDGGHDPCSLESINFTERYILYQDVL